MADDAPELSALAANVRKLGRICPWTAKQKVDDMLYWTRREILEVEEVLRRDDEEHRRANLTAELGDVLFDVLMAIEVAGRDHGLEIGEVCASANAKLRRRSPYIFPDGEPVASVAEAEAAWLKGKAAEKSDGAAVGAPPSTSAPPRAGSPAKKAAGEAAAPPPAAAAEKVSGAPATPPRSAPPPPDAASPPPLSPPVAAAAAASPSVNLLAPPPLLPPHPTVAKVIEAAASLPPFSPPSAQTFAPKRGAPSGAKDGGDRGDGGDLDVGLSEWEREFARDARERGKRDPDDSSDEDEW